MPVDEENEKWSWYVLSAYKPHVLQLSLLRQLYSLVPVAKHVYVAIEPRDAIITNDGWFGSGSLDGLCESVLILKIRPAPVILKSI